MESSVVGTALRAKEAERLHRKSAVQQQQQAQPKALPSLNTATQSIIQRESRGRALSPALLHEHHLLATPSHPALAFRHSIPGGFCPGKLTLGKFLSEIVGQYFYQGF